MSLGVALALRKKKSSSPASSKEVSFSVVEVSNLLNKPSGFIKRELKSLAWTRTEGKLTPTLTSSVLLVSDFEIG